MRITFIDPCDYNFEPNRLVAPLGIGYIAGYLEKYFGGKVKSSIEVDLNYVLRHKPDIIGISAYTQNYQKAIEYAKVIKKETNIPVIVGGKHITSLPKNLHDSFDVGIVGDGEITTAKLIETYMSHSRFLPDELAKIDGIVFKNDNQFHLTPQRASLNDLDNLPKPKRDIMHAYWPSIKQEWTWDQGLYTSRGCPYKCPFCIHSKIKFVSRFHSPERVIEEIEDIIRFRPEQKFISIYDDLFVLRKDRLRAIVDLIESEKINQRVSFGGMCKSNHFDEEIAELLKRMNMRQIMFGFESGDEKTLQYLKKDSSKVEQNLNAINLCDDHGIMCGGFFIIGTPCETKEALNRTYWFIRNNFPPMDMIGVYCLTPFPGTATWDLGKEHGVVDENYENWDHFNYLEYDYNINFFMNKNYDFDFFQKAYKDYFFDLYEKYRVYLQNEKPNFEFAYYDMLYKIVGSFKLNDFKEILEVTNKFTKSFQQIFSTKVTQLDNWIYNKTNSQIKISENNIIGNNKYQMIIFNHSLEQMKKPLDNIKKLVDNNLSPSGKVIILIKNNQSLTGLYKLLFNLTTNNVAGFKAYDNLFNINHKRILENIDKVGLKTLKVIPIPVGMDHLKRILTPLIDKIGKEMNISNFKSNLNIHSHMIYAEKI